MNHSYPYLPEGKTIEYVPVTDAFMAEAMRMRDEHSTELNYPTGAVVVLAGAVIGAGANQAALKNKLLQRYHRNGWCVRKFFKVSSGRKYWVCPGCAKHKHHAESRAVKDALEKHGSIQGADLYLYGHWWCCKSCWDAMINAGIRDVYLVEGALGLFERRDYMIPGAPSKK